ncbi:uncharacterized protein LOC124891161 [Capsicum annuum]|uniref:uncharacterized protein LOC124891161 n=1 Tax=Capsicum annuum TaxID=4072 RepID=UPI001FB0D881|nr:uncharacterized protein LOC124891161 [Capsicum annuum]
MKNCCLQKLDNLLKDSGRSFQNFPAMPKPTYNAEQLEVANKLILEELHYNKSSLSKEHEELMNKLTEEQRSMYDRIITTVKHNKGGFLFLYGHGGIGKTFIWRTLSSAIRSKGDIVLTVASSEIASLLLPGAVGDGMIGNSIDGIGKVSIPDDVLISDCEDPISAIVNSTYPDFYSHCSDVTYLQKRAILAPTLDMVESINEHMILLNQSEVTTFFNSDTICLSEETFTGLEQVHTPEFLITIKCSGIPNHAITLKVGVPVMLLRNIDQSSELCN